MHPCRPHDRMMHQDITPTIIRNDETISFDRIIPLNGPVRIKDNLVRKRGLYAVFYKIHNLLIASPDQQQKMIITHMPIF